MEPYGLDLSEEAVAWVRRELSIPATSGDFLEPGAASTFGGPFDVLTMWYVIEHFADLDLAISRAASLLRPGGILALSTPSGEGASARFDREGFYRLSPEDHFTIWEPSRVAGMLRAYGFKVLRVRITGHHPERLPLFRSIPRTEGWEGRRGPTAFLRKQLLRAGALISRLFGLGDTFEVYALRLGAPMVGTGTLRAGAGVDSIDRSDATGNAVHGIGGRFNGIPNPPV
jgi:SAM-dependent methyltransferase